MRVFKRTAVFTLFMLLLTQPGFAENRVLVFVSIVPQKYIVQQIGNELVDIRVMVPPGASPATYEPKPRQMTGLSKAEIYFSIGVPFEDVWLERIVAVNPKMKLVHTDRDIEKIPMATHLHQNDKGKKHEGDEHTHSGFDPHIWLSPPLVKVQARTILTALLEIDPSRKTIYQANYDEFSSKIDALDTRLKTIFADKQGLRFMVFHPSWGYFARSYGLKQVPIEIEGKNPKPARLKALIEYAGEKDINVIFVQPQFSFKSAGLIAKEIGGQVAFVDPLAEDWLSNLREVADKFREALK